MADDDGQFGELEHIPPEPEVVDLAMRIDDVLEGRNSEHVLNAIVLVLMRSIEEGCFGTDDPVELMGLLTKAVVSNIQAKRKRN